MEESRHVRSGGRAGSIAGRGFSSAARRGRAHRDSSGSMYRAALLIVAPPPELSGHDASPRDAAKAADFLFVPDQRIRTSA